jgi:hypothetical protein
VSAEPRTKAGKHYVATMFGHERSDVFDVTQTEAKMKAAIRRIEDEASQVCHLLHESEQAGRLGAEAERDAAIRRAEDMTQTLERIADPGCESSRFYGEDPPVPDRCLDYEYREDHPTGNPEKDRCDPCAARAALRSQESQKPPERGVICGGGHGPLHTYWHEDHPAASCRNASEPPETENR